MHEPLRVYVCGPAGSGKSTVARHLETLGFRRVSLGEVCRRECRRHGWPDDRLHLQRAGDLFRAHDRAGVVLAAEVLQAAGPLVVDGVRLAAETHLLRAHGFLGIAVDAPAEVRAARLRVREGTARVPDHATEREAAQLPADIWLLNAGDNPGNLARLVRLLVARLAVRQAERRAAAAAGRERP